MDCSLGSGQRQKGVCYLFIFALVLVGIHARDVITLEVAIVNISNVYNKLV